MNKIMDVIKKYQVLHDEHSKGTTATNTELIRELQDDERIKSVSEGKYDDWSPKYRVVILRSSVH